MMANDYDAPVALGILPSAIGMPVLTTLLFLDDVHHHDQQALKVAKTFYLYGHGNEHTTPLIITLKVK
jgi:hypothetical protein